MFKSRRLLEHILLPVLALMVPASSGGASQYRTADAAVALASAVVPRIEQPRVENYVFPERARAAAEAIE